MTLVLYTVAMVFSLCGSDMFILNYQNAQMDKIQEFLYKYSLQAVVQNLFITLEVTILLWFILGKTPKWYYVLTIYALPLAIYYLLKQMPSILETSLILVFCLVIPIIDQIIEDKKVSGRMYLKQCLRFLIAFAVNILLEFMILVIKAGYFDGQNHVMTLSATFCYAIENDIALSILLFTIALFLDREKGDNKLWAISQHQSGSSQTSKTNLQKQSMMANLSKTQKNRIRNLYIRTYCIQLGAFLLVMVLPFLLGKVFEYLVMYLAFAIVRYILGFKYSLHFKKESICVSVSVLVFGILTLAVPFFYVELIMAVLLGTGLAVILHLSYKYKGMFLFMEVANRDRFALLYVFFDGDLTEYHIKSICKLKGLEMNEYNLIYDFMCRNKLSYLAFKYNYSCKYWCCNHNI